MSIWTGVSVAMKPTGELITLAKLKARLRIDHPDDDALLTDLLAGAVALIDGPNGIGYAMMRQTWRLSLDRFPSGIVLPGAPVKSVVSIKYLDADGAEQTLAEESYRVDADREPARVEPAYGLAWPATRNVSGAVKVDYLVGEESAADVSPALIDAVCMIVAHRYENREAVAMDKQAVELPLGATSILREFMRCRVTA